MVKLSNGLSTIVVPSGAVAMYERTGFRVVKDSDVESAIDNSESVIDIVDAEEKESEFITNLLEKPISKWTKEEVKRFANEKGININGTKSVNDAKDRIRDYINSKEKAEVEAD